MEPRDIRAIRETSKSRGLTLSQAAEQIGVGRMTLWRWETGRCQPRGLQLAALEAWLGEKFRKSGNTG